MKTLIMFILPALLCSICTTCWATETVTIATLNWKPYVGKSLQNYGFTAQIVTRAFQRSGYQVDYNFMPWARVLKTTQEGIYDACMPAYYSRERDRKFVFSEPFAQGPICLCSEKGSHITYDSLEDLTPYRIGVVRGFVNSKEFDNADFLHKDRAPDTMSNLKKLFHDRVDLIAIDKLVAINLLENSPKLSKGVEDVTFLGPPLSVKKLHVMFSKNIPDTRKLLHAFNRGLRELKNSGEIKRILQKQGLK